MGRVDGKVVVVTGAARGQGAAEVAALVAEGATVFAADVLDEPGKRMVADLPPSPGTAVYRHVDVTDQADWARLAKEVEAVNGRLDGLVNNAGVPARGRLPDVDLDIWRRTLEVNVTGPLLGIQTLVPLMREGGSIVNVCSVAALSGHVAAPYTASKWALRGLSRTAALELGPCGIRTNAVMPGLIDTPVLAGASPAFREAAVAETPLDRIGRPADVAPLVVFLISDESGYLNGAEIAVDGGLTAHVSHKRIADATRAAPPADL